MELSSISIRHTAWACGGLVCGIGAMQMLPENYLIYVFAFVTVLCALPAFFGGKLWRRRAGLFLLLFALGLCYNTVWTESKTAPVMALDGQEIYASALVADNPTDNGDYVYVRLKFEPEVHPTFYARLYDFDRALPEFNAGDRLEGSFLLRRGDMLRGEEFSGYLSRGIVMLAYPKDEIAVVPRGDFAAIPQRLAAWVGDMVDELFPADTRAFLKALLIGDKAELYADIDLSRDLSHAGLSHIVAVSGMHVSFLVGMIMLFCGARRAFVFGLPIVLIFMLMTGMTPSVVRAGVLYIALLTAPKFGREQDSITTLLLSLAAVLLHTPAAIHSVSLQLSYSAMAGILLLTPSMQKAGYELSRRCIKNRRLRKPVRAVWDIAGMSIGATAFSTPFAVYHFGYIPLYSILANILTNFVVSAVFCLGYAACILGAVLPFAGKLLAYPAAWGLRYICLCAKGVSQLPGSVLYTENILYLLWLALVYLLFISAWLMKGKGSFRPVFPLCLAVISLCAVRVAVFNAAEDLSPRVTVLDVGQGQSIVVLAGDSAVVVDCGGNSMDDPGEIAAEYLLSKEITELDALVLTHLHDDHAGGAVKLMSLMDVDKLILAEGIADEDELRDEILAAASHYGTEICYIEEDSLLKAGDIELNIIAPLSAGSANESGLIVHGGVGDFDVLITGDVGTSTEKELVETKALDSTELYIVGHHGSRGSTSLRLMETIRPDYAAISVGHNNYGHPTDEAIGRALGFGAQLYRTDRHGNITFYIGENNG